MNEQTPGGTTQTPPPHDQATGPRVSGEEMRDLGRLRRTRHDKYVAGVAGGLGRHLDIDPVILRVAFVVLTFFGGAGALAYAACWLLVPEDGSERAAVNLDVRSRSLALMGAGALALVAVVGDAFGDGPNGWVLWPLLIIGLIAWPFLARRDRQGEQTSEWTSGWASPDHPRGDGPTATGPVFRSDRMRDPRKRGPILFWFVLPLIALALGTLGIIDAAGASVDDSAYPALALGIVTVGLLAGAFVGRAGGLILLGFLAALGLLGSTAVDRWDGDMVRETPTSSAAVDSSYDMGAGEMVLDLTEVRDLDSLDGRTIALDGGPGRIEILLPEAGLDIDLDAEIATGGEIRAFGKTRNGWNPDLRTGHDGGVDVPTITVEAELLVGEIVVVTR